MIFLLSKDMMCLATIRVGALMCLGTSMSGRSHVYVQNHVGIIMSGHKCVVWEQTCLIRVMHGHNHVWEQMCLESGHKRVWAQTCLGTVVWSQSCMGTNKVEPIMGNLESNLIYLVLLLF